MKSNLQINVDFWLSVWEGKTALNFGTASPRIVYVFSWSTFFLPVRTNSIGGTVLPALSEVCLVWYASWDTYSNFRPVLPVLWKIYWRCDKLGKFQYFFKSILLCAYWVVLIYFFIWNWIKKCLQENKWKDKMFKIYLDREHPSSQWLGR